MASLERTTPLGSSSHHPGSLLTWTRPVAPVSSSTKRPKAAVLTTVPSSTSHTVSHQPHERVLIRGAFADHGPVLPLGDVACDTGEIFEVHLRAGRGGRGRRRSAGSGR